MWKCPECGGATDRLIICSYDAILINEDGRVKLEYLEFWRVQTEYLCLRCGAVLSNWYGDAVALLEGEET